MTNQNNIEGQSQVTPPPDEVLKRYGLTQESWLRERETRRRESIQWTRRIEKRKKGLV
ncbi:MAG TPA: hypothetical protein VLB73_04120 [Patescibacteria group bacterium]|nr:hypothetical protein [Patescibacteria group bacterium]